MFSSTSLFAQQDDEELDEIVTYGVSTGAKQAIGLQKQSATLVTIISEATLDSLPDQSIGEILARLPGVGVFKDRGEAERIFIRGTDARLNAVTMNGDRLPSPESTVDPGGGQRHARMTTIPASLISEIRVYKAVPPNLDGDSIGGAVQLTTKSATQLTDTLVNTTVRWGVNDLNDGNVYSAEFTFGDRLNDAGTFGMIATLSYESSERAVEGLTVGWDEIDEVLDLATDTDVDLEGDCTVAVDPANPQPLNGDCYAIDTWNVLWRDIERERTAINLTFDYQPSENSIVKFGGFWSEFEDTELRRRVQNRLDSGGRFTTDTQFNSDLVAVSGSTDGGRVRRRVRPGTKTSTTWNAFLDGSTTFAESGWTLDYRLSNTFADHNLDRTRTLLEVRGQDEGFRGDGIADWTFTGGDTSRPQFVQPAWANDPDLLHFGRRGDYRQRRDRSEDEVAAVKFDLSKHFDMGDSTVELQFGYKGSFLDRSQLNGLFRYRNRSSESPTIFMSEVLGANQVTPESPFGYENGIWGDQSIMDGLFDSQSQSFQFRDDNTDENYFIEEDVHAAYVMGTITKGDWTTIVGVRYEDTETDIDARDASATHSYDNFLPAIITRYQPTDNWVIRGAWTNGIARPDFTDLRPFFDADFEWDPLLAEADLSIDGGNPELEPFEAQSFDISVEYYTDNGGVISAGVFYKEIENFEYREELRERDVSISELPVFLQDLANQAIDDDPDPTIPAGLDTLTRFNFERPVNGDDATLTGYEFNFQQKFENLPAPWNNFGVFANITIVDGESDITSSISRNYLIGQFEDTTNIQLYYETEDFSARLAYNRNGVNYESLGLGVSGGAVVDDPVEDVALDVEKTMDLAVQYHINNFTIFFDINNLTDEDSAGEFLGSDGTIKRFNEVESVGRTYVLGLQWTME